MTENNDEYTNLDLDTAEEMLIAAGNTELAQALRFQTQGVRNMMQTALVPSFQKAVEDILAKGMQQLRDDIGEVAKQQAKIEKRQIQADKAVQNWRVEVREELTNRFNAFGEELTGLMEAVRSLGGLMTGLRAKVDDHETRIGAIETHGAPADAVDLLSQLDRRVRRVEQRQIYGFIALALVIVAALILLGGG